MTTLENKDFKSSLNKFRKQLPLVLDDLVKLIETESTDNSDFIKVKDRFLKYLITFHNTDLNLVDVNEMIIQHILTEDILINLFDSSEFFETNPLAISLRILTRTFFTKELKRSIFEPIKDCYKVIIRTASSIYNHKDRQTFLHLIFENFYSVLNKKNNL
jgi:predicted helicase